MQIDHLKRREVIAPIGGADLVNKIVKGERPSEIPVEQPSRYEIFINLRTAKALAMTTPPALLVRADEVIE